METSESDDVELHDPRRVSAAFSILLFIVTVIAKEAFSRQSILRASSPELSGGRKSLQFQMYSQTGKQKCYLTTVLIFNNRCREIIILL